MSKRVCRKSQPVSSHRGLFAVDLKPDDRRRSVEVAGLPGGFEREEELTSVGRPAAHDGVGSVVANGDGPSPAMDVTRTDPRPSHSPEGPPGSAP